MNKLVFIKLNPWVLLTYYVLLIIQSMVLKQPVMMSVSICLLVIINLLNTRIKQLLPTIWVSLTMGLFILLINPIVNRRGVTGWFMLFGQVITKEAIIYAMVLAGMLIMVLLVFHSFNQQLSRHQLLYLFQLLTPKLTLLLVVTIGFVPQFMQQLGEITKVQQTRKIDISKGSIFMRSQALISLIQHLLIASLDTALQTADSMNARGFGVTQRSSFRTYRFTSRDLISLLLLCILGFSVCVLEVLGYGRMTFFPKLSPIIFTTGDYWLMFYLVLLFGFPILLEGWEYIWWKWYEWRN